ncbi:MAG: uncharacterized protein K0R38_4471 [Polyangiaceae bacterium]|nr:uncharacterized protein [Polyangiaceae bacterium]
MNERKVVSLLCALAWLLSGCREKASSRADKEPLKVASATATAPPPATGVSARVVASAAPVATALPAEHGPPLITDLVYVDDSGGSARDPLRLHALQGAFLATRGDAMFRVEGDKLVPQSYGFVAEHPAQEFVNMNGRYPDSISATALVGTAQQSERGTWYSFEAEDVSGPIERLVAATGQMPGATWLQGSRLLYEDRKFVAVSAGKNVNVPQLAASPEPDCESRFRLKAFAASLDGSVVAVGLGCGESEKYPLAERWEAGKSDGRVSPLRSRSPVPPSVTWTVVLGPGRLSVIVASDKDSATTWRETSDAFQEVLTPVLPDPLSVAVGIEGELWLVSRPGAAEGKRARAFSFDGKRWSEVKLPSDAELRAKLGKVDAPETLWLRPNNFAVRGDKVYLSGSVMQGNDHQVGSAILTPVRTSATSGEDAGDSEEPGDLGCVPQVVLFAVSKTTPPDYQYPATRDAVVGSRFAESAEFLEVMRAGQRTLIARTKTRKAAKALAAHIAERIAGSKPAAVCEAAPEVLRQISMR